jgi:hypothetical protein
MDSDAEIENHKRQLEQTLLQLKIAKSVAEAKQFCTTDLDDLGVRGPARPPEADDKMMQNPGNWAFPGS